MTDLSTSSPMEHIAKWEDSQSSEKTHQMRDILVITECAVICAAVNWLEKEESSNWDRISRCCLNR